MYIVYNESTGYIVARLRDAIKATNVALEYTEQYAWVDGSKFDVGVAE